MADVQTSSSSPRRGPRPLRLDMTPMVDLAFLLLTFFILTTTLRRQHGLELTLPSTQGGPGVEREVLTFLVSGKDVFHAYRGPFDPDRTRIERYGLDQVRVAIQAVQDTSLFVCLLKPHRTATHGAMVRLLDEVGRLGHGHYAIDDALQEGELEAWEAAIAAR